MIRTRKQLVSLVGSEPHQLSSSVGLKLAWKYKGLLSPHAVNFTAEGSGFSYCTKLLREEKEAAGEMVRWML